MYSTRDLSNEIAAKIEALREAGRPILHPDWITQEIMEDHQDDMEFLRCTSRACVREGVRHCLSRFKLVPTLEADKQIVLPGFERLQEYYMCTREGTQQAVHVDYMTNEELELKAVELEAMAEGCNQHADEIRRFIHFRRPKKSA